VKQVWSTAPLQFVLMAISFATLKVSCGSLFLFLQAGKAKKVWLEGIGYVADIETTIRGLAEPIVDELGIDYLGVVMTGSGDNRVVRVVVDCRGGVGVEALRRLSKGLSLQLDAEDLIPGKYHLEISSPGFDWPLTTASDYARYLNDYLRIKFENGVVLEGENLGLDETGEILRISDGEVERDVKLSETRLVIRTVNWSKVSGGKKTGNAKKTKKSNSKK